MAVQKFVADLKSGLVLAEKVVDKNGIVLLKENTVISDHNIWDLENNHILTVMVTQESAVEIERTYLLDNSVEGVKTRIRQQLIEKIGWEPDNKFELDLFEMAVEHRFTKKSD
jgi:hypothetical protein